MVPLGKGARAQGQIKTAIKSRNLNEPCRTFITNTEEYSHGEEEEEEENGKEVNDRGASLVLGPRPSGASDFARSSRSRQAAERCSAAFVLTRTARLFGHAQA
jgi:hypothetical protein